MSETSTIQPVESHIVQLTRSAAERISELIEKNEENHGKLFRIFIEEGGCSGIQYGMTFDEERDGDIKQNFFGADVIVDSFSAEYLKGSIIDFNDGLNDSGFKITNPNAKQSCGCGRSFET